MVGVELDVEHRHPPALEAAEPALVLLEQRQMAPVAEGDPELRRWADGLAKHDEVRDLRRAVVRLDLARRSERGRSCDYRVGGDLAAEQSDAAEV